MHALKEENFNACIEIFLDVPLPWQSMAMARVRRRSFVELLVHGGAALALPEYRESIGRLKKPRGTEAYAMSKVNFTERNTTYFIQVIYPADV